ncbi:hypothetical protein [Brevibacillus nitrificans]|uniref:hypothetical protein n=1 Tax=Brevibacillus nitrificans TaxID=651560 RepID=UPI002864C338|nr:hypothetical protein [Brevibacillus nitrificans]MDR7318783.1 hypothetical protein [Brevibacillus nitrificans]
MKRLIPVSVLVFALLSSFLPRELQANGQPVQANQEPSIIYQVAADGKSKKIIAQMPYMHRGAISPSGTYVYAERIGYGKDDPTVPYLYSIPTKKLTQLSGFAKWSPKQDMLYLLERGGIIRVNPRDGTKNVLVKAVPQNPVLDFAVSPDEQYMAYFQKNGTSTDLYLQHLPTGKTKRNDQFVSVTPAQRGQAPFYWMPTSKKLFYQTKDAYKELDLPTGLKYVHQLGAFPSYSSDMKYRYMRVDQEEYLLDLTTGKKVILQKQPQSMIEGNLQTIFWSPKGHRFAAEEAFRSSGNARDVYMRLRLYSEAPRFLFPFGEGSASQYNPYSDARDNVRLIGWNKSGDSFYVADWSSVHFTDFAADKLDELERIVEKAGP